MKDKVTAVIDSIRPALQADGGDIEFIELTDDGIVKVRLQGACGACPMSELTLKMLIERAIMDEIPEVKEVINIV
ncbi:NifU family protein [bacterium]|jgi:Fe-S cluster biogenesis protein NfuA|nr:NifU family protein [bacterium]